MNKRPEIFIVARIAALLLALALTCAAVGKLFFPLDMPSPWETLSKIVAVLEIIFALLLIRFYYVAGLWEITAIILAGWAGYSVFWMCAELPCGCLGKMLDLPNGMTFGFDLVFFVVSAVLVGKLDRFSYRMWILALVAAGSGYLAATQLFTLIM